MGNEVTRASRERIRDLARYLVERQDLELWAKVLKEENEDEKLIES